LSFFQKWIKKLLSELFSSDSWQPTLIFTYRFSATNSPNLFKATKRNIQQQINFLEATLLIAHRNDLCPSAYFCLLLAVRYFIFDVVLIDFVPCQSIGLVFVLYLQSHCFSHSSIVSKGTMPSQPPQINSLHFLSSLSK